MSSEDTLNSLNNRSKINQNEEESAIPQIQEAKNFTLNKDSFSKYYKLIKDRILFHSR